MSATIKKDDRENLINLKFNDTFTEMKQELEEILKSRGNSILGDEIVVDIGAKQLNNKQLREIEDILLDYGVYLKELRSKSPPRQVNGRMEQQGQFIEDMAECEQCSLVRRNLRSGQKCFAEGNLVIIGDVNPGAEIIAGGNILIIGSLRGMAHAGAFGDEKAIIAAYRLRPTQLRIANHITRPPDGESIIIDTPEMAHIRSGKVIIEKLKI